MRCGFSTARKGTPAALLFAVAGLCGCSSSPTTTASGGDAVTRGSEWVEATHGKTPPDTAKAFPDTLRTLSLQLSSADWAQMLDAVASVCGPQGSGTAKCTGATLDSLPICSKWFSADLAADGQVWKNVGIRLKGSSDLAKAWAAGAARFPFKLTMDKLEDSFPTIKNQRFYGFKKLELSNLHSDPSLVRNRVASSLLRAYGVPAPFDAPLRLKLVHGSGSEDLGIYSLREIPDNPLLDRDFGQHSGNLYAPSSSFQTFVQADFADDGIKDYSDVQAMSTALHDAGRTTASATWRRNLSDVFDASAFLKWLAVSTVLRTEGVYGSKADGYGLYDQSGKMRWISEGMDGAFGSRPSEVWHTGAGESWPLVSYLLADPAWCAEYAADLRSLTASGGLLSSTVLQARINASASPTTSVATANTALANLLDFAASRATEVDTSIRNHPCP